MESRRESYGKNKSDGDEIEPPTTLTRNWTKHSNADVHWSIYVHA